MSRSHREGRKFKSCTAHQIGGEYERKISLYEPKNPEEKKEFDLANRHMDMMIESLVKQTNAWHERHSKLGSMDTASLEAVAVAIGKAMGLRGI